VADSSGGRPAADGGPAAPPALQPAADTGTAAGPAAGPERVAELETQLAQMRDRYLRARADLENVRKRAEREAERHVAASRETMLLHWLEAMDSVERAIRLQNTPSMVEGLRSVLEQMDATLARHGVTRMQALGRPFDPEHHEAVAVQDARDVADRTVVDVARSGYAIGDRVLRPAQVVVSRGRREDRDGKDGEG